MSNRAFFFRACLTIARGAAARDFGFGQGGEGGASPQQAVTTEPTPAKAKRPAARRVFAEKAVWLRCSSVEDPPRVWTSQALRVRFPKLSGALSRTAVSFVAPRHPAFSAKTAPLGIFRQALTFPLSSSSSSSSSFSKQREIRGRGRGRGTRRLRPWQFPAAHD